MAKISKSKSKSKSKRSLKASPARERQSRKTRRVPVTAKADRGLKRSARALPPNPPGPRVPGTVMTDFTFYANPTLTLIRIPPDVAAVFSLDDAAHLTGVHPDMLRYYNRAGLIEILHGEAETDLFVDETTLHEIRRIEYFRRHLGIGRRALPLICELRREADRQQIDIHFLRVP